MDLELFRRIVKQSLAPLVGAELEPDRSFHGPVQLVSFLDPCRIGLLPESSATSRLVLHRSQIFTPEERQLAEDFVRELQAVDQLSDETYLDDLLQFLPRRVIARHLQAGPILRQILEQLEAWASQTYEGQRITAAVGIDRTMTGQGPAAADLWSENFAPVLSNGFDTILVVDGAGRVCSLKALDSAETPGKAPYRLRQVAAWAQGAKIAVVLNRQGELLVLRGQVLRFARRSGRWIHYTHDTVIKKMSPPVSLTLRKAIHETCLDVAFARTGGCLGILKRGELALGLIDPGDRLRADGSLKGSLFCVAIEQDFERLDRRLRQELLALDGAVVLNYSGRVLAVGAILQVPAGSSGGGRLAAATRLSESGLGIKISADGQVRGFRNSGEIFRF